MSIPETSLYPDSFDSDENLYLVHDSLRVRLAEDYTPGDTSITIEDTDDGATMEKFPSSGFITLTEQQSDPEERAISFWYASKTDTTFDGLILSDGIDSVKPKLITNVTQSVMNHHHNALKDALIAIQEFVGVENQTDLTPFGNTLQGRINFLRKLIWTPRAWFTMDKRVGLVPLCVTFTDQSFRLGQGCGEGEVIYIWDFGDETHSIISVSVCSEISAISTISAASVISAGPTSTKTISVTSTVPIYERNVLVRDLDGGSIKKCYTIPNRYNVSLRVINQFGEDTVVFSEIIDARIEAPDVAVIDYDPQATQDLTPGIPSGGPYTTPPVIRSPTDTFIQIQIPEGENPNTPGRSYAGELLDNCGDPIDPIITYTWNIADDLEHENQRTTKASFGIGGLYDLALRVDTQFGSYRITTYENTMDIVEEENLWLWMNQSPTARAYEFGLASETFKAAGTEVVVNRDDSFLDYLANPPYDPDAEARAKREFSRNTAFTRRGTDPSGISGTALLFWAIGGSDVANQKIAVKEHNGFADTYESKTSIKERPWNWTALISSDDAFFVFGTQEHVAAPNTNPSNPELLSYSLSTLSGGRVTLTPSDFTNGADTLLTHPSVYDGGVPTNGYFATYRGTWKDSTGYLLRNSAVNEFFRIDSFFKTLGSVLEPFQGMTRLQEMTGATQKTEGELVTLSDGLYFFNNSSEILAYNETSEVWEVGGPSVQSVSFRSLQDTTVSGFNDTSNTLLAASDNDSIAYLSFDYSPRAFIKFNSTNATFNDAGVRPSGSQFLMGIY